MAISKEDNHDVAKHLGKALAKKVSKVTDDSKMRKYKSPTPTLRMSSNALEHAEGRAARIRVRPAAGDLKFEKYTMKGGMKRSGKDTTTIYASGEHNDY